MLFTSVHAVHLCSRCSPLFALFTSVHAVHLCSRCSPLFTTEHRYVPSEQSEHILLAALVLNLHCSAATVLIIFTVRNNNKLHFRLHAYNIPHTLPRHFLLRSPTRHILGSDAAWILLFQEFEFTASIPSF